jgi:hypothetical protein
MNFSTSELASKRKEAWREYDAEKLIRIARDRLFRTAEVIDRKDTAAMLDEALRQLKEKE